jgi:hypothetical protein
MHSAPDALVVVAIVLARLGVPLLIPRAPLIILVALVIDAVDQTLLAALTDVDTTETGPYQSVDKALDIYYLSIAYLATMRNWSSVPAVRVSRFLYYYRLVGVVLFELTDARAMLLLFPNTFEFFFIAYELIRGRYEPSRFSGRFWVLVAAALWVFIKLPQEYWIHVAQLDFTDTVSDYPAFGVAVGVALTVAAVVVWKLVLPRLPAPDWAWRFDVDPVPPVPRERGRIFEKVCLLALVCTIFASILPGIDASFVQIAAGVTAIVVANAVITIARAGWTGAAALLATNLVLVYLANALLGSRHDFDLGYGLFFAFLIAVIIGLYDAFRPVYERRLARRCEMLRTIRREGGEP